MISIVIPLYNEDESLKELTLQLTDVLDPAYDYELIFIDDGSTDNSLSVLRELANSNEKIKVISHRANFGKSAALATGFSAVSTPLVTNSSALLIVLSTLN